MRRIRLSPPAPIMAAVFLMAAVLGVASRPVPAAERGYTFENVDRMALAMADVIKARWGCPPDWDYRTHTWEDCRMAAAHKDLDAYDRAAKAARRLFR